MWALTVDYFSVLFLLLSLNMKLMLYVIYLDTVLVTMTKAIYKRAYVCRDYRFKRLESMTIMAGSVAASGMVLELRLTS